MRNMSHRPVPGLPEAITTSRLLAVMAEVVAERGEDFVYTRNPGVETCFYVPAIEADPDDPRRQTGCLIGEVLKRTGHLGPLEATGDLNGTIDRIYSRVPEVFASARAMYVALVAQSNQDDGKTWGESLRAARMRAVEDI